MAIEKIGTLELRLMLILLREPESNYSAEIRRRMPELLGVDYPEGAIATVMGRLERKGYVSSEMSEPIRVQGGRSKRVYTLEPEGRAMIERSLEDARDLLAIAERMMRYAPPPPPQPTKSAKPLKRGNTRAHV